MLALILTDSATELIINVHFMDVKNICILHSDSLHLQFSYI